jgi:hypothetical protein
MQNPFSKFPGRLKIPGLARTWIVAVGADWIIALAVPAAAAVPNPFVTGPIPATAPPGDPSRDYVFFASHLNLAAYGYVEEEYFIEGAANRYSTPAQQNDTIIDSDHPYRTRMVVRRPASAERFNDAERIVQEAAQSGIGKR